MNKLYFDGYGYIKTEETTLRKAFDKLVEVIQHDGFEIEFNMIDLHKHENNENELFFEDCGCYKTSTSNLRAAAVELIDILKNKGVVLTLEKTTLRDQNDNVIEEVDQLI